MEIPTEPAQSSITVRDHKAQAESDLEEAPAHDVIKWISETFHDKAGLSCSFGGAGGIILAHMASQCGRELQILFVDTDFLFPETYALKDRLEQEWGFHVQTAKSRLTPDRQEALHGRSLWERNPDLCCRLRKVEPMAEMLGGLTCWVTALRRDQSPTRADLRRFELHRLDDGREILKVNPLAYWTRDDAWDYIIRHKLPYNSLLDQGYASLGCTHCTARTDGEDEREGRWIRHNKTECGLHTFTRKRG